MQTCIRFICSLVVVLMISCALNSLLMELHFIPKQAASRTGVLEKTPGDRSLKVERQDVAYGDFWLVDKVPSDGAGYVKSIDSSNGEYQVRFPMGL